eukprot:3974541-Pleurochrysis_carterae.AAC.1
MGIGARFIVLHTTRKLAISNERDHFIFKKRIGLTEISKVKIGRGNDDTDRRQGHKDEERYKARIYCIKHWGRVRTASRIHKQLQTLLQNPSNGCLRLSWAYILGRGNNITLPHLSGAIMLLFGGPRAPYDEWMHRTA